MKNPGLGQFWSLRPRLGVTRLEVACAAMALALAITLVAQPPGPRPVISQASAAPGGQSTRFFENPLTPPPTLPQACIKRVLALSHKEQHFDLVGVMESDCFGGVAGAPIGRTVTAAPTCLLLAGWHDSYGRLTTGCLVD